MLRPVARQSGRVMSGWRWLVPLGLSLLAAPALAQRRPASFPLDFQVSLAEPTPTRVEATGKVSFKFTVKLLRRTKTVAAARFCLPDQSELELEPATQVLGLFGPLEAKTATLTLKPKAGLAAPRTTPLYVALGACLMGPSSNTLSLDLSGAK